MKGWWSAGDDRVVVGPCTGDAAPRVFALVSHDLGLRSWTVIDMAVSTGHVLPQAPANGCRAVGHAAL